MNSSKAKPKVDSRRVFIPEAYLSMSEKFGVLDLPNLGVGKTFPYRNFSKLMDAGKIDRRVVVNFEFRIPSETCVKISGFRVVRAVRTEEDRSKNGRKHNT